MVERKCLDVGSALSNDGQVCELTERGDGSERAAGRFGKRSGHRSWGSANDADQASTVSIRITGGGHNSSDSWT